MMMVAISLSLSRSVSLSQSINHFQVWNGIDVDFLMFFWVQVSLDRIWNFLQEEELPKDAVIHVPKEQSGGVAIEIKGGEFSWNSKFDNEQEQQQQLLHQNTLSNINLQVKSGSCVAICGTVGSGKSSLLSCILGEIPKLAGTVRNISPQNKSELAT
jgi:ABC-type multidrug transport system fused ATPase/permease subunit